MVVQRFRRRLFVFGRYDKFWCGVTSSSTKFQRELVCGLSAWMTMLCLDIYLWYDIISSSFLSFVVVQSFRGGGGGGGGFCRYVQQ